MSFSLLPEQHLTNIAGFQIQAQTQDHQQQRALEAAPSGVTAVRQTVPGAEYPSAGCAAVRRPAPGCPRRAPAPAPAGATGTGARLRGIAVYRPFARPREVQQPQRASQQQPGDNYQQAHRSFPSCNNAASRWRSSTLSAASGMSRRRARAIITPAPASTNSPGPSHSSTVPAVSVGS